jgi:hypothetical protein
VAGAPVDPGDPGPATCVSAVRAAAFDPLDGVTVQDLGEHLVGEILAFSVPAGSSSFTLVSQEVNDSAVDTVVGQFATGSVRLPNAVVPDQIRTPAGALYYDDIALDQPDVVYYGYEAVSSAFTAPNTTAGLETVRSAGELPAGTWTFRANDWANECAAGDPRAPCTAARNTGRYRLHAVTKTSPLASTGAVDLEVYLLTDPANAVSTAAAAAASPRIRRWATSLSTFLGRAGLCLGTVTFHDLPAWLHRRFPNGSVDISADGPCSPISQLFTAAVAPRRAVHLFLVEELLSNAGPGGSISIGIDGSIPGPSGFPGTIYGGAAVGLFGALERGACTSGTPAIGTCGPDYLAYVAAHEVGHWLGLYHSTEADGLSFDPLTDTPRCPCPSCAPAAERGRCGSAAFGGMLPAWCTGASGCGGGSNLMFWLLDEARSTGALSRDQGQVVRLNPAVR